MGACLSTPEVPYAAAHPGATLERAHRSTAEDGGAFFAIERTGSTAGSARCHSGTARIASASSGGHRSPDLPLDALLHVHEFQNTLAAVSDAPGLGLAEAAELLQTELGAALVSIYGFCLEHDACGPALAPAQPPAAVLLAACGAGTDVLERCPVVTDPAASVLQLRAHGRDALAGCAATPAALPGLPADWRCLALEAGLRSFLAVPIGPVSKPWGALVVAAAEPNALRGPRWRVWPNVAAVALVHQVRHWQTAAVCGLLRRAAQTEDRIELISGLLTAARSFMERATAARTGVRLALLDGACESALVFELSINLQQQPGAAPPVVALELPLKDTLLASALATRKARFVRDCASYMQNSAAPARDVFTQPAQLVSSLVVVPLVRGDEVPLAAFYVTLEAPSDFSTVQEPLLGFINTVLPMVYSKLEHHIDDIWEEARAVRSHSTRLRALRRGSSCAGDDPSSHCPTARRPSADSAYMHGSGSRQPSACDSASIQGAGGVLEGSSSAAGRRASGYPSGSGLMVLEGASGLHSGPPSSSGDSGPLPEAHPSSYLASCNSKRLCTSAMLKVVEQEIHKCKRLTADAGGAPPVASGSPNPSAHGRAPGRSAHDALATELVLTDLIGAGGFGAVWRGSWKKVTAAIKVMFERGTEQEAMMDAVEMAVLSAVSHPHIIQVFTCLTEMVEASGMTTSKSFVETHHSAQRDARRAASEPGPRLKPPQYRRLLPFEDPEETETCNIAVMEYCDLGSLRQVAQRGLFHRRLSPDPRGAIGVDLAALLEVALEVAEAVAYLHSIRLCHCDIKLDNVLLKSEVSQPRGYIAKLGDFGLAKVLGTADAVVNVSCTGTVNHLAPELFTPGSRVTTAVDAYAFGVLLYELYMGGVHAYAGLNKHGIIERVARAGMRPRFPAGAPHAFADLASACWAQDPTQRPSFPAIISSLHVMLQAVSSPEPTPRSAA